MDNWYFGGYWFFGWMFFMFLFFFVISRFWWWGGRGRDYWQRDHKDAMHYLDERYAKGEIAADEYEKIKRDITRGK